MASFRKEPNRRVLVLDDEVDVLEFLRLFLEALGWEVTVASTPDAALRILERSPHFLVISDIAMPVMDGYEFMNEVVERKIPSKLAFMTGFGYDPNHTLVKIRKGHHYPCLFKPFNREKVAQTVRQAYESYTTDLTEDKDR
jgi:two-component system, sensor histidine kinase SagS